MTFHNHLWIGVFAASFVQQHAEEWRRLGSGTALIQSSDRFCEEASAMADEAVCAYRRMKVTQTKGDTQ